MKKSRLLGALFGCMLITSSLFSNEAQASSIGIVGYDISNARVSSYGHWGHTYTGTISAVGFVGNYSGGTGTMANGTIESSESYIQLFHVSDLSAITIYLDDYYTINTISIYGGDAFANTIPGGIAGTDITIDGNTLSLMSTGFGSNSAWGVPVNDLFTLIGTSLDGLLTNQITLSMFSVDGCCEDFSIAEIIIDGDIAAVPIPAALWFFGSGLLGLIGMARKKVS